MNTGGGLRRGDEGQRAAQRTIARARLVVMPIFVALAFLQPDASHGVLMAWAPLSVLWIAATAALTLSERPRRPSPLAIVLGDVVVLGLGTLLTDGSDSLYPFVALVGLCALAPMVRRRHRTLVHVAFAVCVGGPVLVDGLADGRSLDTIACFFGGFGVAAVVASRTARIEHDRRTRLRALVAERDALLSASAALAEDERRSVSQGLHDGVLQTLLAAGQDLDEAARAGASDDLRSARELVRTSVGALRTAVTALHPRALVGDDLPHALAALVEHHRAGGAEIVADIDPAAAGEHDHVLLALSRELVTNALVRTNDVHVSAWRDDQHVIVDVAAEGGTTLSEEHEVLAAVGVAWALAGVREAGGGLTIDLAADHLLHCTAWAPVTATIASPADPGPRGRAAPTG